MNRQVFNIFLLTIVCISGICVTGKAQQKIDPSKLNYIVASKQNTLVYNDTVYRGSKEFAQLFYRTHNDVLIHYYQQHQSNKIWGNVFVSAGTFLTAFGIISLSNRTDPNVNNSKAWISMGAGLGCTIFGGYLLLEGQKNLLIAVQLFNTKYAKTSVAAGVTTNGAAVHLNF